MRASPNSIIPSSSSSSSFSSSPASLLLALLLALAVLPNTLAAASAAAATRPKTTIKTTRTTTVTLSIPGPPPQQQQQQQLVLPSSTHATLSGASALHRARLDARDGFVFRNVTPGSYLADVHCGGYGFAPLRVDVLLSPSSSSGDGKGAEEEEEEGGEGKEVVRVRVWETFRGNDWENRGEEVRAVAGADEGEGEARFPVRVLGPKVYYTERGSFSIFGILKNPMILMGLVSMALFVGLPKLVENMDPEMRAEFEEQQKKNPMASLSGRLS